MKQEFLSLNIYSSIAETKRNRIPKKLHSSCQLFICVAGLKAETNGSHLGLFLK